MNDTEALSYLAEIIDAARAGGAPREYIQGNLLWKYTKTDELIQMEKGEERLNETDTV